MNLRTSSLLIGLCFAAAGAVQAETLHFMATLAGSTEVPPNATTGVGDVAATLDTVTGVFSYKVTYAGLTGPAAMAHFHGPAGPGANAPPVITMTTLASPIAGSATLAPPQVADLTAGHWYFNVHTAAHMSGEIRGQLTRAP